MTLFQSFSTPVFLIGISDVRRTDCCCTFENDEFPDIPKQNNLIQIPNTRDHFLGLALLVSTDVIASIIIIIVGGRVNLIMWLGTATIVF